MRLPNATVTFTTRQGGVSEGPYESLNLGILTDDDQSRVAQNREIAAGELRLGPLAQVAAVHLPAHGDAVAVHAGVIGRAAAVLLHVRRVVVGEDPEVQRLVGPLAHAALAGGEGHGRVREPHCACSRAS